MFVSTAIKALMIVVYIIANVRATCVIHLSATHVLRNRCNAVTV